MSENNQATQQIARAASAIMAAFILSNVVGLARQILVSQAFGTGLEIDAFNAAARLPDLLFNLVAGGALASAFIPTFTGLLTQQQNQLAWRLTSSIANLISLLLLLTSLLAAIFAEPLVRYGVFLLVADLDPAALSLTVSLLRILLISPVIFGLSGLLMGVLNAHQIFLLPALAPTMYWMGMILGVLLLAPSLGIFGLAWGAVLGSVLHLLVQLPALRKVPVQYFPGLGLKLDVVRQVILLMGPRLVGVGIVQLNFIVNTILAAAQPLGSLTAIQIAWAVMTMPQVVIAQAIAIASLPTFSRQAAAGRLDEMRTSLSAVLRGVILLSLPAAVGLILLREPVVALLFQRGEFDARSTDLVAWALLWYAAGLLGHSVVEVLSRAFYALKDTRTPVATGAAAMTLNLLFSFIFSALFISLGWLPHGGLALANSLATAIEMVILLALMRQKLGGLASKQLLQGLLQAALASAWMALVLLALSATLSALPAWLFALLAVGLGLPAYLAAVWLLRVPEARLLWQVVLNKIGRRSALSSTTPK